MAYSYGNEEVKTAPVPKKIYIMINNEKHYIDPEIVKKYNLESEKVSFFREKTLC